MRDHPPMMQEQPDIQAVRHWLLTLQDQLCAALTALDPQASWREDRWERPDGGGGRTRVVTQGAIFEQGGINFSHVSGEHLPASATAKRPALAGRAFEALGLSLVLHPRNPYVPATHLNVRCFVASAEDAAPLWWFGGGFDLTPCYGFVEDVVHWHRNARDLCAPFGADLYPRLKQWCDEYFCLPHRGEARGVGGIFFDDFDAGGFAASFAFARAVGEGFLDGYRPIVERRHTHPYGQRERDFLKIRRGRYVEFNLVLDRGTLFGLHSGGRTESILVSLPPEVSWRYAYQPEPGSPEARLEEDFLRPRDWLAE